MNPKHFGIFRLIAVFIILCAINVMVVFSIIKSYNLIFFSMLGLLILHGLLCGIEDYIVKISNRPKENPLGDDGVV